MLVLSRRINEKIRISDDITITVVCIKSNQVQIGIDAPEDVSIAREEIIRENKDSRRK